jgi:hypothetical protein
LAMPAEVPDERPELHEVEEEIFDPVAAVAREAEAKGKSKGFPFTVEGELFRMKSPQQIGRKTMKRIELLGADPEVSGSYFMDEMFKALLGVEQFTRYDDVSDLNGEEQQALLTKSSEYYGIDLPESPASTRSSKPKRKR